MHADLTALAWTSPSELVEALARRAKFELDIRGSITPNCNPDDACAALGLESEPIRLFADRLPLAI